MKLRHLYLFFCVVGFVLPYWQFLPWVVEHGLNMRLFFQELFASRISSFFGLDVFISAVVFGSFASTEAGRLRMKNLWLPFVGLFLVGVSLALPLFLYLREPYLARDTANA